MEWVKEALHVWFPKLSWTPFCRDSSSTTSKCPLVKSFNLHMKIFKKIHEMQVLFIVPSIFVFRLVFSSDCPFFKKYQRRKSTGAQLYVFSDALFPRLVWNWSHNASFVTWKYQTLDNIFTGIILTIVVAN